MKAMQDKEALLHAAGRLLTWTSIFAAVVVFWGSVSVVLLAWLR